LRRQSSRNHRRFAKPCLGKIQSTKIFHRIHTSFCLSISGFVNLAGDKKQVLCQRHAHGTKLPSSWKPKQLALNVVQSIYFGGEFCKAGTDRQTVCCNGEAVSHPNAFPSCWCFHHSRQLKGFYVPWFFKKRILAFRTYGTLWPEFHFSTKLASVNRRITSVCLSISEFSPYQSRRDKISLELVPASGKVPSGTK
jgi:hypothetical protein